MPTTNDQHTEIVWVRVDAIVNLILENDKYLHSKRNAELTQKVMGYFGISERTAQRYVSEAKKEIRKIGQSGKKEAFIRAIRDREFLFSKAKGLKNDVGEYIINPDFRLALEIIKDRDKIYGLYVDEVNVNGEIRTKPDLSGLSIEELKAIANLKRS